MFTIYPEGSKKVLREENKVVRFENVFDLILYCSSKNIYKFTVKMGGKLLEDKFNITPKENNELL